MRALAERLVRDASAADDLVQDTWLAALRSSSSGRLPEEPRHLRSWLAHVLANFSRARNRADERRSDREAQSARRETLPSAADSAERIEAQRALVDALARLAEPYRTAVMLRYLDGLCSAEIARRLGVPAGTVRWRLKHAIDELRTDLDRRYGGDRGAWCAAMLSLARRSTLAKAASSSLLVAEGVWTMNVLGRIGVALGVALLIAVGVWRVNVVTAPRQGIDPESQLGSSGVPAGSAVRPDAREESPDPAVAGDRSPVTASISPAPAASSTRTSRVEARFVDHAHHALSGVSFELTSNLTEHALKAVESGVDGRITLVIDCTDETWNSRYAARLQGRATRFGLVLGEKSGITRLGDIVLEPGGSVSGTVLGPDGAPVQGAHVFVTDPELASDLDILRRRGPETFPGVPSTRTASGGSFRIDGVPARALRVWAGADEMRFSVTPPIDVRAGGMRGDIMMSLEALAPDDRIGGIVRDPDGRAVDGAFVEYWYSGPRMSGSRTVTADHDGRFHIDLEQKVPYDLYVRDPKDRWPECHVAAVVPGSRELEVRFSAGRSVEVVVRTQTGEAVSRFAVRLKRPDGHRLGESKEEEHADGRASICLPTQAFVIEVLAPRFSLGRSGPLEPDDVRGPIECALTRVPGIAGRVLARGTPIAGAHIELVQMCAFGERMQIAGFVQRTKSVLETTVTDADGRFRLTARERSRLAILCDADGFATAELSPIENDPAVGSADNEVALSVGGAIEGRVFAPDGFEPSGDLIEISRGDGRRHEFRVGADGAFRFDRLTPGRWEVRRTPVGVPRQAGSVIWQDDEEVAIPSNCVVADGETAHHDFDLRSSRACQLVAHVSCGGRPAAGWMIVLWSDPRPKAEIAPPTKTFGEDGTVRIEASPAGRYMILLSSPEDQGARVHLIDRVELVEGGNTWNLDLPCGRVEGRIGPASLGQHLYLYWEGSGEQRLEETIAPDVQGNFQLEVTPAGRCSIRHDEADANGVPSPMTLLEIDVPSGGLKRVELP
jgi:RNA polymerase sigma-70 factor (ECF subfamily)